MIPAGLRIFIALEPVDMQLGFERLAGLVRERIGYEPRSGALFLFLGKRRETLQEPRTPAHWEAAVCRCPSGSKG